MLQSLFPWFQPHQDQLSIKNKIQLSIKSMSNKYNSIKYKCKTN
uniref:Uncharacterized protein n=1 Tax=Ciona intestinalis TaxID=7719 RepID=H2XP20_CIOIN